MSLAKSGRSRATALLLGLCAFAGPPQAEGAGAFDHPRLGDELLQVGLEGEPRERPEGGRRALVDLGEEIVAAAGAAIEGAEDPDLSHPPVVDGAPEGGHRIVQDGTMAGDQAPGGEVGDPGE